MRCSESNHLVRMTHDSVSLRINGTIHPALRETIHAVKSKCPSTRIYGVSRHPLEVIVAARRKLGLKFEAALKKRFRSSTAGEDKMKGKNGEGLDLVDHLLQEWEVGAKLAEINGVEIVRFEDFTDPEKT